MLRLGVLVLLDLFGSTFRTEESKKGYCPLALLAWSHRLLPSEILQCVYPATPTKPIRGKHHPSTPGAGMKTTVTPRDAMRENKNTTTSNANRNTTRE